MDPFNQINLQWRVIFVSLYATDGGLQTETCSVMIITNFILHMCLQNYSHPLNVGMAAPAPGASSGKIFYVFLWL